MSFLDLTETKVDSNVLPAGKYVASVTNAEVKDTKDGSGQYINAEFSIIDEDFKGRKVFQMFNIKNRNEQAVTIGMSQLKSLMLAAGASSFALNTVSELCGLCCQITLKVEEDSYGKKNKITSFKAVEHKEETTSSNAPF